MKKIFIAFGHHNTKDSFNSSVRDTFIDEATNFQKTFDVSKPQTRFAQDGLVLILLETEEQTKFSPIFGKPRLRKLLFSEAVRRIIKGRGLPEVALAP